MWRYRLGFGALCVATVLVVAWIATLMLESDAESNAAPPVTASSEPSPSQAAPSASTPETQPPATASKDTEDATPDGVPAGAVPVRVSSHTDGDTIHVVPLVAAAGLAVGLDTTVRLLEIDTPESVDPNSPVQCFSAKASEGLERLLPQESEAWALPDKELLDPYDRALLYLWSADGTFVNLKMIHDGFARAVLYEPNDLYISQMRAAERRAKSEKRGLWGACDFFGQPKGFLSPTEPASPPAHQSAGTDPRFSYCYEANDAGYGNYVRGVDPEYDWYDDADRDGRVCEF
jgi:micrococcal nuclease